MLTFSLTVFTPITPCYITHDTIRVLPVPLGELGGGHVLQGRVDSVMVVALKRRIQRLFTLMHIDKFPGQTYSFLSVLWNDSMCPFCSGVLTYMYSRVIPRAAADDLNSLLVYWDPLSTWRVKPDVGLATATALFTSIMALWRYSTKRTPATA